VKLGGNVKRDRVDREGEDRVHKWGATSGTKKDLKKGRKVILEAAGNFQFSLRGCIVEEGGVGGGKWRGGN